MTLEEKTSKIEIRVKPDGSIGIAIAGNDRHPIALIGLISTAIKVLHDHTDASYDREEEGAVND